MTLHEKYKDYFAIGAAVNVRTIDTHKDVILREFNSLTCENEMKYGRVCPDGKIYDFAGADAIRDFAVSNGKMLRLHTFLWHNQTPGEIFEGADKETLLATLKAHIGKMAERYAKDIYTVDVANEVIDDKHGLFFRDTKWYAILGDDFLDYAFRYTREAMPNALLCYNDYNECDPDKSKKIFDLVKGLRDRGIPVDTLGLQAHWSLARPALDDIKRAFELYAKLGVTLQVTEMDVSLYPDRDAPAYVAPPADVLKKQAQFYKDTFAIFREYKDIMDSVTLWGVADDASWLSNFQVKRKNWPLLFDDDHQPKEAYYAIMDF